MQVGSKAAADGVCFLHALAALLSSLHVALPGKTQLSHIWCVKPMFGYRGDLGGLRGAPLLLFSNESPPCISVIAWFCFFSGFWWLPMTDAVSRKPCMHTTV